MKKQGRFEKAPAAVPEKQPKVKDMLLQTYFTSLLCMILCVSMFFGTSYAWFSSEVTNTTNEIYAGTLKVGLYKKVDGEFKSMAGENAPGLFSEGIRWEPGYTALETIRVVNEGDLAFKYTLTFTDGEVKGYDLQTMASNFEVYVYSHHNQTYTKPNSIEAIRKEGSGWSKAKPLNEILNGSELVLDDKVMEKVRDNDPKTPANAGTDDGLATPDEYTIAVHMKEEAYDTKLMGKKLRLSVKLVAYQKAEESDSLGNSYDNVYAAMDVKKLQEGLSTKKNILLTSAINIDKETDCPVMIGGLLDGSGKTITYKGPKSSGGGSVGVLNVTGGTIRNLTVQGSDNGRALYVTNLASNLYVSNCKFSGAYAFNMNTDAKTTRTLTFVNTEFKSWTSFSNAAEHVYFTDCTFSQTLRPYGDTTLTNCTFDAETLDVSMLEEGETITLINCLYNGKKIENAVLTATKDGVKVTEGKVVISDELIVKLN